MHKKYRCSLQRALDIPPRYNLSSRINYFWRKQTIKKGFTLIELLVVVLIIGILAAVALPQYQQAVEKSRAAEAVSSISSFRKALEVWKLGNPNIHYRGFTGANYGVGQLDIDVPADWVSDGDDEACSKNFCYDIVVDHITARRVNNSTYKYEIKYWFSSNSQECLAKTSADLKLCKSLSDMSLNDDSL